MDEILRLQRGHRGERIRAAVAEIQAAWNGTKGSVWSEQLLQAIGRDEVAGPELARLETRAALLEMQRLSSELSRLCAALGFPGVGGAARALADALHQALGGDGSLTPAQHNEVCRLLKALGRAAGDVIDA